MENQINHRNHKNHSSDDVRNSYEIDMSKLQSGVYLYKINVDGIEFYTGSINVIRYYYNPLFCNRGRIFSNLV